MKVIVYHARYCESGCCGHYVELQDDNGEEIETKLSYDHPPFSSRPVTDEGVKRFIKAVVIEAFGEEHCKDIDFDQCVVSDY